MPPQRTPTTKAPPTPTNKSFPMKTERTHEENQERAYIAASRRSDRSLEARVESARRASEIHKRRTGRALRVTEEDVLNDEMYEEEDDDLPLPYRQLTQHLTTGSAEFNRRLAAYLTNHVAVRSALDQIIRESHSLSASGGADAFGSRFSSTPNTSYVSPLPAGIYNTTRKPLASPTDSHMSPTEPKPQFPHQQMLLNNTSLPTPPPGPFHMGPLGLSTISDQRRPSPYARPQNYQARPHTSVTEDAAKRRRKDETAQGAGKMGKNDDFSDVDVGSPFHFNHKVEEAALDAGKGASSASTPRPKHLRTNGASYPTTGTNDDNDQSRYNPSFFIQKRNSMVDGERFMGIPSGLDRLNGGSGFEQGSSHTNNSPFNLALPQNAQELLYGGFDMSDTLASSLMTTVGQQQQQAATGMSKVVQLSTQPTFSANRALNSYFPKSTAKSCPVDELSAEDEFFQMALQQNDQEYDMSSFRATSPPSLQRRDTQEIGNTSAIDDMWSDFLTGDSSQTSQA